MRIIELQAENVKRLKVVHIRPDGPVVQITGANGSGKSSVLDAIAWALTGKRGIDAVPLREGTEHGHITLDLGEFTVTRTFEADGHTALTVTTKEGAKYPSPQSMLDGLLGALSMDPLAFLRLDPAQQSAQLAALVGLAEPLRELEHQHFHLVQQRRDANREVKRLQASIGPEPEAVEPVDIAALLAERQRLQDAHARNEATRRAHREARENYEAAMRTVERLRAELEHAERCAAGAKERWEEETVCAMAIIEPPPVEVVDEQLRTAQATNDAAHARQVWVQQRAQLGAAEKVAEQYEAAVQANREAQRLLVAEARMPIDGLTLGEDGLTFRGLPLAQASSAEQLRVATAIAIALNPRLRVVRIKDGSLLDEASLALLEELAAAHDVQVWIERVDTSGTVGVVMVDGTAHRAIAAELAAGDGREVRDE